MAERYAEDGEFVERFRREAQAAARLNHPNIVAVYDRGEADGRPYIAMEYLQGRTLKQVIQAEGPLPPERAIAIAMQVLAGLRYAHEHGVVHRDVKPHNVLVGDDGRIKVTDFGIAHAGDPQMTEVGSIVGTAQYLSPEQARGRGVGPQTDIYSLGVVLYEMLTGPRAVRGRLVGRDRDAARLRPAAAAALARAATCPSRSRSSSRTRCSRTRRSATAAPTSSRPTSIACGAASCRSPRRPRTRRSSRTSRPSSCPRSRPRASRRGPRPTPLLSGEKLPARPTPRKRSRWPWLLVLLLLLAVGALAAFAIGGVPGDDSSTHDGESTTTGPTTTAVASHKLDDLEGKTYQEAKSTLSGYQLGLVIPKAQPVRDATHEANIVVASDPPRGCRCCTAATPCASRSRAGR